MGRHLLPLAVLFVLLAGFAGAEAADFYADVVIDISENGEVEISGTTNHPALAAGTTQEYTSKDGAEWSLGIGIEDVFSDFIYEIRFPENASVGNLGLPGEYRVEEEAGRIIVVGTGEDERFFARADYVLGSPGTVFDAGLIVWVLVFALAFGGSFTYFRARQKKTKKVSYNREALTERQRMVMDYLEGKGKAVTQAELRRETGLPKASLSRNLDSLVAKGIVAKERKGMSMLIYLRDE